MGKNWKKKIEELEGEYLELCGYLMGLSHGTDYPMKEAVIRLKKFLSKIERLK